MGLQSRIDNREETRPRQERLKDDPKHHEKVPATTRMPTSRVVIQGAVCRAKPRGIFFANMLTWSPSTVEVFLKVPLIMHACPLP